MSKDDFIKLEAVVEEVLPSTTFNVRLESGIVIRATVSGKMRLNKIRILPGDKVTVEISPYDVTRGRIVYRNKNWLGGNIYLWKSDHQSNQFAISARSLDAKAVLWLFAQIQSTSKDKVNLRKDN